MSTEFPEKVLFRVLGHEILTIRPAQPQGLGLGAGLGKIKIETGNIEFQDFDTLSAELVGRI